METNEGPVEIPLRSKYRYPEKYLPRNGSYASRAGSRASGKQRKVRHLSRSGRFLTRGGIAHRHLPAVERSGESLGAR